MECTPELLSQALDNPVTARVCAEIEDALEKVRRGEMSRDDFETLKAQKKKQLPILTPHAMFKSGRRLNSDAVASGLSMYDIDHISDPRGFYEQRIAGREKELGIVMAHVTPSTEGLRLLFIVPQGLTLGEAQQWMSKQLDDYDYDGCVKDLARCSFLVPRRYVVYMDFGSESQIRSSGVQEFRSSDNSILRSVGVKECRSVDNTLASNPSSNLRSSGVQECRSSDDTLASNPSSLTSHPSSIPPSFGGDGGGYYTPFPDVSVSLNDEGCLVIDAPGVCAQRLVTNDCAELHPDGRRFRIIGRKDNVINSGGIKIHAEEVEQMLRPHLSMPFIITKATDPKFGEVVALVYEEGSCGESLQSICQSVLPQYWQPRRYLPVEQILLTETGKPRRDISLYI